MFRMQQNHNIMYLFFDMVSDSKWNFPIGSFKIETPIPNTHSDKIVHQLFLDTRYIADEFARLSHYFLYYLTFLLGF